EEVPSVLPANGRNSVQRQRNKRGDGVHQKDMNQHLRRKMTDRLHGLGTRKPGVGSDRAAHTNWRRQPRSPWGDRGLPPRSGRVSPECGGKGGNRIGTGSEERTFPPLAPNIPDGELFLPEPAACLLYSIGNVVRRDLS